MLAPYRTRSRHRRLQQHNRVPSLELMCSRNVWAQSHTSHSPTVLTVFALPPCSSNNVTSAVPPPAGAGSSPPTEGSSTMAGGAVAPAAALLSSTAAAMLFSCSQLTCGRVRCSTTMGVAERSECGLDWIGLDRQHWGLLGFRVQGLLGFRVKPDSPQHQTHTCRSCMARFSTAPLLWPCSEPPSLVCLRHTFYQAAPTPWESRWSPGGPTLEHAPSHSSSPGPQGLTTTTNRSAVAVSPPGSVTVKRRVKEAPTGAEACTTCA